MTLKLIQLDDRAARLRSALEDNGGNVSAAAAALGVGRQWATRLLRRYDLVEFAAQLRLQAGRVRGADGRVTGRPRVS